MNRSKFKLATAGALIVAGLGAPALLDAQGQPKLPTEAPGKPDPGRVAAGSYKADPAHTQIAFTVNHLGFSLYHGLFGDVSGTMTLDPRQPSAAKVSIDIPMSGIVTTSAKLDEHLKAPDFFDAAKYSSAHFESKSIEVKGTNATIAGNLTIKGVTKPVTLHAKFTGAGKGMMGTGDTVGFEAATTIKRSDFGLSYGIPMVSDQVDLAITVAFEKMSG